MSNHRDDEKSGKKNRKRLKRLYQQIREQMEFYLSDANLQKDRFLKQQMTSSADGCIDLDVFLRCNKILSLTSDMEVLTNAITTSKKLMVDKEKKRVGRLVPYSEPKDVDERTVYVECLPTETDREWIRKVFGACGKIVYISLPRYKSTGDIKGFAFVEYETMESAQKACELINHPPAEAEETVGRFPRNKQLKQLERQVHFQENVHGRKRRASESEMEKGSSPKAKRKRTMSEGKNDEVQALPTASPTKHEPPAISCKRRKSSDSGAVEGKGDAPLEETPAKEELQSSKSRRRKSSECGDAGIALESKSETPSKVTETTSKSKKAKKELKAAKLLGETTDLKKSVKRARLESTEDVACVEAKPESTKKAKKKEETPEATIEAKTKASKKEETPEATIEVKTKALKKEETPEATIEAKTKALKKEETPEATIEAKTKALKKEETSEAAIEAKRKALKKEETPEAAIEAKTKALKRKAEGDESSEKKAKKVKICDERTLLEEKEELNGNEVGGEAGKKKKRQKKNKKTKTKDIPELRVIPKKEWLSLRSHYLKLQKANMSQLKEKLKEIHKDERSNKRTRPAVQGFMTYEEKESETKKKSEPEFIEGVIVKVTTDQPFTRNDLKERIWAFGSIAYIDVKDQDTLGHIRCNDQETAVAISQASLPGYAFQRLSGVDEKAYWQKLIDDRNKKHTTKTRPKQRGRDKILHKADVAYEKVKKPLHIIFD